MPLRVSSPSSSASLARPKSVTRGTRRDRSASAGSRPAGPWSSTLLGLRSRWTMPRSCGVLQGPGQRGDHPGGGPGRHRLGAGPEPGRQRRPVAIRRGDIGDRAPLIGLEDRDDMGMIQDGRGVRLAHEPPPSLRGSEPLGQGDLQRHVAAEDPVAREVNDPETAPADLPHHLEPAEGQRRAPAQGAAASPRSARPSRAGGDNRRARTDRRAHAVRSSRPSPRRRPGARRAGGRRSA